MAFFTDNGAIERTSTSDWEQIPGTGQGSRNYRLKSNHDTVITRRRYDEHVGRIKQQGFKTIEQQRASNRAAGKPRKPRKLKNDRFGKWSYLRFDTFGQLESFRATLPALTSVWVSVLGRPNQYQGLTHRQWVTVKSQILNRDYNANDVLRNAMTNVSDIREWDLKWREMVPANRK